MSLTIIDNTKLLPPILEWAPKPTFKKSIDKLRYWEQQKKYWIEGYNGLPGSFYFYIQECIIKDRVTGKLFRPQARDVDLLVFERVESARKNKQSIGILKGRGVGLSTIGGGLTNYFLRCFPGSTCLVTSSEQAKISSLFSQKLMTCYDNMDPDIKPFRVNRNETKSAAHLKVSVLHKNDFDQEEASLGQILCRETSEKTTSPNAFSGDGAIFGFYDELPLHKRKKELLESSIECYRNPKTKEVDGLLMWGGTVEHTITNEQLSEFQKLVKNSDLWKTDILFVPFWMSMTDQNGHADEKRGMEWYDKELERLEKIKDEGNTLIAFKKNNPKSLDDIFDLASGSMFEQDVSDKIKLQHKNIVASNIPITTCRLVETNGVFETLVDKKGKISILENPKPGVEYRLEIDGVSTGTDVGDQEGSSVAGSIIKGFDPEGGSYGPVCIYEERPDTVENSYHTLMNVAKYYNKHSGLKSINPEGNAGNADHISTFLDKHGMGHYISFRKDLSGKGYSNTKKRGTYVTKDVRDWQIKQANIFLRKYIGNIKMIRLLEDLLKPKDENADVRDSWFMWFVDVGPDFDKPIIKRSIPKRTISTIHRRPDGTTYWKEIEVNL